MTLYWKKMWRKWPEWVLSFIISILSVKHMADVWRMLRLPYTHQPFWTWYGAVLMQEKSWTSPQGNQFTVALSHVMLLYIWSIDGQFPIQIATHSCVPMSKIGHLCPILHLPVHRNLNWKNGFFTVDTVVGYQVYFTNKNNLAPNAVVWKAVEIASTVLGSKFTPFDVIINLSNSLNQLISPKEY